MNKRCQELGDSRVRHIINFVNSSLSDPSLTVTGIAREVHLSCSRVRFLMRTCLGHSPKHYILNARILYAERLLLSTFLSVKEVMVAVGMSDPTHFGKEFKKRFGVAPREYRRSHRQLQRSA